MDTDLKAYFDQHFGTLNRRFDEMDKRLDRVETEVRHAHILIEHLDGNIRAVSEGVAAANERLDQFREEVSQKLALVESFNRVSYKDLDTRVRLLESPGSPWKRPPEI